MQAIATIPLKRDPALSIPFRLHVSADGRRMAVLNTFGMPYHQELIVVDTHTHEVLGRWTFEEGGGRLFNLDVHVTADGTRVLLVGGVLQDEAGQDFEPDCTLTCLDLESGGIRQTRVGPVGFNYVSAAPDGGTAFVFYNGAAQEPDTSYRVFPVDLGAMRMLEAIETEAPVNNVLYRPAEGRAVVSLGRDVVAFDLATRTFGDKLAPRFNHPYLLAAFSPDEDRIYAAYVASQVVVKTIDIQARSVVAQHAFNWGWTASTNIVPFGDDHLLFPPGSSAGAVCLWNRHTGEIDRQAGLPSDLILATPHPDGRRLYLFDYTEQALKLVDADPLFAAPREAAGP